MKDCRTPGLVLLLKLFIINVQAWTGTVIVKLLRMSRLKLTRSPVGILALVLLPSSTFPGTSNTVAWTETQQFRPYAEKFSTE